mgnify:CR=1 FL=1
MSRAKLCAAMAALTVVCGYSAAAGAQAIPSPTGAPGLSPGQVEKSGDWELVCGEMRGRDVDTAAEEKKPETRCRLIQNHAVADGMTLLLVTIVSGPQKTPVAIVSVPKSVYLAPGIEMKVEGGVDGGKTFKLLYETCNDQGCHAGYRLTGEIGAALRKGRVATHTLFDSAQKPIKVDVSLLGLSKGLERLAEASK